MNNIIEINDHQFANSQVSCDLRDNSHADVASEEFPAPIGKLLGLTIISSGAGRATIEFEASARYANPMGTLHGGVLCDLADAAMGIAYRSTLAEGETFTTIELKINFLRPVWNAKLRAQAKMARAGKVTRNQLDKLRFGPPTETRDLECEWRGSQHLPEQIDADERLPGYLREPHLPPFESRRTRNFTNSLGIADQSESFSPACSH